LKDIKIIQG
jgi:ribonuclease HI